MRILAIGDVVGTSGCNFLKKKLPLLKEEKKIDLVIANGENSAEGNGITKNSQSFMFGCGVDVITSGNHAFRRHEIFEVFKEEKNLIRPANYPRYTTPGSGICFKNVNGLRVCVINLLGTVFLENVSCPFGAIDSILKNVESECDITILDFHAEATAEKRSLAFYVDGRISAMFGTHTHVPTADETILPNGTGYITDVGMTGVINSSLGVKYELTIKKFRTKLPVRFENATGACRMDCVIFDINESTGKTESVERISVFE